MNNTKVYILTIISSMVMISTAFLGDSVFLTIVSSIGCSALAAAVMAVFLEIASEKKEKEGIKRATHLYFKRLNDQLTMLVERILWFDERMYDEGFNWDLDESVYSSFQYNVAMASKYPERRIPYDEGMKKLREIGEKYNLENMRILPDEQKIKVHKMFKILSVSSIYLLNEANAIKQDQLILDVENYLSIEDNRNLMYNISFAIGLMHKEGKNYQAMIDSLISVIDRIRTIGYYSNDIRIGIHGSFSIMEL